MTNEQRLEQLREQAWDKGIVVGRGVDVAGGPIARRPGYYGEPEAYGLPPKPQVPTIYLKSAWTSAIATAIGALIIILCAFAFL